MENAMKMARLKKRLSRAALAAKVGCSYSMIQQIETDKKRPSLELALAIAKTVGKSADALFFANSKD